MNLQNGLFHRKVLQQALERHGDLAQIDGVQDKLAILRNWRQAIESASLKHAGEVALHGDFLIDIFARVLGYPGQIGHPAEWQLTHEQKTLVDATKSDGALGFFSPDSQDIRVVIELKSIKADLDAKQHRKDDKRSPVEQAFGYVHKAGGNCRWVIVSNYQEIRLYHASFSGKYEVFQVADLSNESEFRRFYCLLARDCLFTKTGESRTEALYRQSAEAEQTITGQFYAQYTQARRELFAHLKQQNPERSELALLAQTQQLLDRFIFICFCEDSGDLLPEKTFRKLIQRTQDSIALAYEHGAQKIWMELKAFFRALNEGLSSLRIPAFNGELFKPDPDFDALRIADPIFLKLAQLTEYDFQSDLNVNILGHIFEQSLIDLEEMRAEIRGAQPDRKQSKRKKEGIFYTPEYITRYIVEQAIGGWLEDRQQELGWDALPELTPEDEDWLNTSTKKKKPNTHVEQHIAFYDAYLERLKQITVLDPACGSGAFLTQAFDYLLREGARVNRELNRLRPGEQLSFLTDRKTWDKAILRNNLFGVDLNPESVEITKLALWLKTAKKDDQLTSLNQNIKCGNSLIDDPAVAGDKAFDWAKEFPEIMQHGGFDVVIGNPPYLGGREWKKEDQDYLYLLNTYHVAEYQFDIYHLFIEKSILIVKPSGYISLITPNTWLNNKKALKLREYILSHATVKSITDYSRITVFQDAVVLPVITTLQKQRDASQKTAVVIAYSASDLRFSHSILQTNWNDEYKIFNINLRLEDLHIRQKIEKESAKLEDLASVKFGIKLYETGKGTPPQKPSDAELHVFEAKTQLDDSYRPYLEGKDITRYAIHWQNRWLKYGDHLAAPRAPQLFTGPRLLVRRIVGERLICAYTDGNYVTSQLLQVVKPNHPGISKSLLVILNSRLIAFYFQKKYNRQDKTFPEIRIYELASLPIKIPQEQSVFIEKADTMLELNQRLSSGTQKFLRFLEATYHPKTISTKLETFYTLSFAEFMAELGKQQVKLTKQAEFELMGLFEVQQAELRALKTTIEQTDCEIDQMVYHLYGLTAEEIESIESAA